MVTDRETRIAQDGIDGGVADHEHLSGVGRRHLTYLVQPGVQGIGVGPARRCAEQGEDLPRVHRVVPFSRRNPPKLSDTSES
jgi:hypothetical protein